MEIQKINISKTGSKITVESAGNELIDGLSFQIGGRGVEPIQNIEFEKEAGIVTLKEIQPRSKFFFYVDD